MNETALYDLDHTLIHCDSDYEWGQFLSNSGVIDGEAYQIRNQEFYDQYLAGTLDPNTYLEFVLKPLSEIEPDQLSRLRESFLEEKIRDALRNGAQRLITKHREAGFRQIIVTSTNAFIAQPIAELLQIETLIAPHPEMQNGRYTGKLLDGPCYGEQKPKRILAWAQQQQVELGKVWAYSDSFTDVPLLEFADVPFAVDPDPQLRTHALRMEWPIISLSV